MQMQILCLVGQYTPSHIDNENIIFQHDVVQPHYAHILRVSDWEISSMLYCI